MNPPKLVWEHAAGEVPAEEGIEGVREAMDEMAQQGWTPFQVMQLPKVLRDNQGQVVSRQPVFLIWARRQRVNLILPGPGGTV